jgi:molybdopterin/thiamine biosynthesis adenylyltransferase
MNEITPRLVQSIPSVDTDTRVPEIFRLSIESDRHRLQLLLEKNPQCTILDQIEGQLRDLLKLEHPARPLTEAEYQQGIEAKLAAAPREEYGVWVYYPWRNQLIHLLDEEEFIRVRTIRNAYKITFEEQAILRKKKVGVIGLSVGQSVSLALALERIAGEIRIADFDTLELSNLNRIRTGVHNLGVKKTTMVAREIAEIDPFIKVVCFDEGMTQGNASDFFERGGKLDMLIEECDGLDVKIFAREEAKKRRIPVIMEMSDRCMLDIERYDLDPNYPILHGLVGKDVDFKFLSTLQTTDEKMPYMMPISGSETLSPKMKASILELTSTLTTWPQLASDVSLGGAISAIVVRKILLGDQIESKRHWLDIEKLVGFKPLQADITHYKDDSISDEHLKVELEQLNFSSNITLPKEELDKVIEAAILAPSPGNNQTWRFVEHRGVLAICDPRLRPEVSFGDNLNMNSHIAFGAALENMSQMLNSMGYEYSTQIIEAPQAPHVKAVISISNRGSVVANHSTFISKRQTLRRQPNERALSVEQVEKLLVNEQGFSSRVVTEREHILKLGELISKGDRIRLLNKQGHVEFFAKEVRLSREEAKKYKTGLDVTLFPFNESDKAGLRLMADPLSRTLLDNWNLGRGLEKLSKKSFVNAPVVVVYFIDDTSPAGFITAGRLVEREWLRATEMDIYFQPMTVLQSLFSFLVQNPNGILSPLELDEIRDMKEEFDSIFPDMQSQFSVFLAVAGNISKEEEKSFRKDKSESFVQL